MSEKRFAIVDKEFLGYTQGYAYIIRDNSIVCEPHRWRQWSVWEDKEDVEDLCDLLNEQEQKIQRWKTLYEIKDKEVTARVKSLQDFCNNYFNNQGFKSDTDPNVAVKQVLNELLNTEVKKNEQ